MSSGICPSFPIGPPSSTFYMVESVENCIKIKIVHKCDKNRLIKLCLRSILGTNDDVDELNYSIKHFFFELTHVK